jgi:pimeloyl-ACP methyl ester carboxylesterase
MIGNKLDVLRSRLRKKNTQINPITQFVKSDYGIIRMIDTGGCKPVIICAPDMPNVIEHHEQLISQLSINFRVVCFEFPGSGLSQPNNNFDYSLNSGANLILNIMDILRIKNAILSFSCSNSLYAIKTAEKYSERVNGLFLIQGCSISSLKSWSEKSIPTILTYPVFGQISNMLFEKKIATKWYNYALPKETDKTEFIKLATDSIIKGGCFCLSSLVQGLGKEENEKILIQDIPSTMIWGCKDYTHRLTNKNSILELLPNCSIIEFDNCGHFPELENSTKFIELINRQFLGYS